jgi:tRNA (cmo5U34)-methyltransferase
MTIQQAFDQAAQEYDQLRRKLIPCFDDFYGTALSLLPRPTFCGDERPLRVLELGAGTGLLTAMVLEAIPLAEVTLVDLSPQMLAQARQRLAGLEHRIKIVQADYLAEGPSDNLADNLAGPFSAVVSALSIHHLEDPDKLRLFAKVHGLLAPGGVFVNADQMLGATPAVQEFHQMWWLKQVTQAGITPAQMSQVRQRMTYDRPATLADQLNWLRQAGFGDVDCHYRHHGFAVYAGRK